MSMYMNNRMLAFLMMLLLGIDIFPTIEDVEDQFAKFSGAIMRED